MQVEEPAEGMRAAMQARKGGQTIQRTFKRRLRFRVMGKLLQDVFIGMGVFQN